jgi:nucleolar complex protein 2
VPSTDSLADSGADEEDSVAEHRQHLARLREQDPEFFAFLRAHDDSLLRFAEDTASLLETAAPTSSSYNAHDDDSELLGSHRSETNTEDSPLNSEAEAEADSDASASRLTKEKVTKPLQIDASWFHRMQRELRRPSKRMAALRRLVSVFSRLVRDREPWTAENDRPVVSTVLNNGHRALLYIVVAVPMVLCHELGAKPHEIDPEDRRWQRYRRLALSYANTFLLLFAMVRDPLTKCFLIRRVEKLTPFLTLLPKWAKALIRDLASRWMDIDELVMVRSQVHTTLRTLVAIAHAPVPDIILRECYRCFTQHFKSRNPRASPAIDFCLQSARELFAQSAEASYRVAFTELRELGVQLRKALQTGHGCDSDAILNWSFIHSLEWWSHLLAAHPSMASLRSTFIQIMLVLIDGLRSLRLFGARFACIRSVMRLARETQLYVPLAAPLLEMLDFADLQRKPNERRQQKNIAMDWQRLLRIQEDVLSTSAFREAVIDEVLYMLLDWLAMHTRDAAFPELALPVQRRLVRLQRLCKSSAFRERLTVLITRLKEDIRTLLQWRGSSGSRLAVAPANFVSRLEQRLVAEREKRARIRPTGIVIPEKERQAPIATPKTTTGNAVANWQIPDKVLEETDDVLVPLDFDEPPDDEVARAVGHL